MTSSDEIIYPMVDAYVAHWTIVDGLRELIANAHDAQHYTTTYDTTHGFAIIHDDGPGLQREHLLLGMSTKHDNDTQIGQFGEGLKLALKTAASLHRTCRVDTAEFCLSPEFAVRPAYGTHPVLVFHLNPGIPQMTGTTITIECTPSEWEEATTLFWDPTQYAPIDPKIPILYTPGGALFVQDLRAGHISSPFTYRLLNKHLTNRDRTVVDSDQLTEQLLAFWGTQATVAHWIALLQAWAPGTPAHEFHLPWDRISSHPTLTRRLRRAIAQVWSRPLIVHPHDSEIQQIHAKFAGYTTLRDFPATFAECILERMGNIPRMDRTPLPSHTADIIEDPTATTGTWTFPVTRDFAKHLTFQDCLRELAANAIDAGTPTLTYHAKPQTLEIIDEGSGIRPEHLLMGQHERPTSSIGTWGTGLKEAWARLTATLDTPVQVETVGRTYSATFQPHPMFPIDLWQIHWESNSRTQGTVITIPHVSSAAYHRLQEQFLQFRALTPLTPLTPYIFTEPNHAYYHGSELTITPTHDEHSAELAFSYELEALLQQAPTNMQLAYWHRKLFSQAWSSITDPQAIDQYFERALAHPDAEDFGAPPKIPRESLALWRKAARSRWGSKCCLSITSDPYQRATSTDHSTDHSTDARAEYVGYTILPSDLPRGVVDLLHRLGIPWSNQVGLKRPTKAELAAKAKDDALAREQALLQDLRQYFQLPETLTLQWWDPLSQSSSRTNGLYLSETHTIFLNRALLAEPPSQLLGTLLHELAHYVSEASDLSSRFEQQLTHMLGVYATHMLFNSSNLPMAMSSMDITNIRTHLLADHSPPNHLFDPEILLTPPLPLTISSKP